MLVVAVRIVFRLAALDEPSMLVAGVVDDQVEHQFHTALLDAFEQFVEVGHGAELGHNFAVIANVVSVVGIGRVVMRTQPDHVDPEALDVVELGDDAFEVAYAVAVGVFERAWVDLVDDGLFPSLWLVTVDGCRGVVLTLS